MMAETEQQIWRQPVIVWGVGEIGGVLARAALKAGHPVYPINRGVDVNQAAAQIPKPHAVMLCVREADFHDCLKECPRSWRDSLVLVQNELLPQDWARLETTPTVISIWFEKKKPMDAKPIRSSPAHGPLAGWLIRLLQNENLPSHEVSDPEAFLKELVLKNLYILVLNIAGLKWDTDCRDLWQNHRDEAMGIFEECVAVQNALVQRHWTVGEFIESFEDALAGDWTHRLKGRSAPQRLERVLRLAADNKVPVPKLNAIAEELKSSSITATGGVA